MTTNADIKPVNFSAEWPFTVELVPLERLFVDNSYQRPPQEKFVEKMIEEFDETLVGALDVSNRNHKDAGYRYAILDGRQRFEALKKFKKGVFCAIYSGMSIKDEAMFFYKKNKNRRSVHPFYQLRALIVTGDKAAGNINRIVESEGYKLGISSVPDNYITAIRAVESTYNMTALHRKESLSPALHVLRQAFYGRSSGKDGSLIKGLGRFFHSYEDGHIDYDWLVDRLAAQNPANMLGRAYDKTLAPGNRNPMHYHIARDIVELYNRNRPAGKRLSLRLIQSDR